VSLTHQGGDSCEDVDAPVMTVTGAHRGEKAVVSPTIVRVDQTSAYKRNGAHSVESPLNTVHSVNPFAVTAPYLVPRYGERDGQEPRTRDIQEPAATVVPTGNGDALVAATLVGCGGRAGQSRPRGVDEPTATQTAKADGCLVAAHLTKFSENSIGTMPDEPLHTAMAGAPRHGLVAAFMAKHYGGHETPGADMRAPVSTVTAQDHHAVVSAGLVNMKGSDQRSADVEMPSPAVCAQGTHIAEVRAFLMKYYGTDQDPQLGEPLHTATAKARFGLVLVDGVAYEIADIGMRMLSPRELFRAQGFPESYVIDPVVDGKRLTKTAQIRMCGNSVCPPMAEALVRANFAGGLKHAVRKCEDAPRAYPLFGEEVAA
jgi:DNA (cytosine-5)-methyltransferase 1